MKQSQHINIVTQSIHKSEQRRAKCSIYAKYYWTACDTQCYRNTFWVIHSLQTTSQHLAFKMHLKALRNSADLHKYESKFQCSTFVNDASAIHVTDSNTLSLWEIAVLSVESLNQKLANPARELRRPGPRRLVSFHVKSGLYAPTKRTERLAIVFMPSGV